jgi:effector-binding domain-containing protein
MKKVLIIVLALGLAATISIYTFIPKKLKISQITIVKTTEVSAFKFLSSVPGWQHWFKGTIIKNSSTFIYNKQQYTLEGGNYNALDLRLSNNDVQSKSEMKLLPFGEDSLGIYWECTIDGGINPFNRVAHYRYAIAIKKNMQAILDQFKTWINKKENIYGVDIRRGNIQDSVLMSLDIVMKEYPNNKQLYALLQKLQDHYKKYGAVQNGKPMLHTRPAENGGYHILVAIPISKDVPNNGKIVMKHMFKGYALTADITGGTYKIRQALAAIEKYLNDYRLASPAVPFQSIITNRILESDSNKWVTKLYYPIY